MDDEKKNTLSCKLAELMVLGSISLLLVVFQGAIQKVCIHEDIIRHMLPCKYSDEKAQQNFASLVHAGGRRLLSSSGSSSTCKKVVLISLSCNCYGSSILISNFCSLYREKFLFYLLKQSMRCTSFSLF